ncbi:hypothetical protein SLS57_007754 [Botryosphaeria dothidea]
MSSSLHSGNAIPGPKLAAVSAIPYWYYDLSGKVITWTTALHEAYGDVVRLGPDRLSYINQDAWKAIYGHKTAGHKTNPKDSGLYRKEKSGVYTLIAEPNDKRHSEVRQVSKEVFLSIYAANMQICSKIFSHAFSEKALKLQEGLITRNVDKLINNIQNTVGQNPETQLDIVKLYNCTTFDIMGELTFGEPLGLLDKSEYTPWVATIFQSIKALEFGRLSLEYPLLRVLFQALVPASITKGEEEHYKYSNDRVDHRLAKGLSHDQADIWNLVIGRNKGVLNVDEMRANGMIFMVGGTETTATVLSGLTYLLLTNPDKFQKVIEEVRALREDQLNLETLPHMEYLSACFEEALRCYPPVPTGTWREAPEGGNNICGDWVPSKTHMVLSQYAAFQSPSNFKDPSHFIPERWLPGTGYDNDKKEALQPFSYGPRNCIGKSLAYHEMRLIFSKVVWHFDLSLCPESRNWTDQKAWSVWDKRPLWIQAKRASGA